MAHDDRVSSDSETPDFIAAYGEEKFIDFLIFTIKYHINDLHGDNVAYRNGKPCLSDYSGYWS